MTEPDRLLPLHALVCDPRAADAVVARDGARILTRARLRARAGAWAAAFAHRGGTNWAVNSADGFELLAMILGAWSAGRTAWLAADALPATVAALRSRVDGFAGEFAGVDCVDPGSATGAQDARAIGDGLLVVYTSGSSGEPVAIPKTVQQLDAEVRALHACWGTRVGRALVVASVPHRHLYGLLFKLLWPALRGAPFLARSLGYPEEVLAALEREPCVWIASPALLKRLPPALGWDRARAGLRAVFSSGGPLAADAAADVRGLLGAGAIEVYGSSETGGIAARVQGEGSGRWHVLPGVEIDCEGSAQTLAVRSPWLGVPGWWTTADRASRADDGSFELHGRVDRIAKVEDKRVSLDAVERALGEDPRVAAARVVQMRDGRLGAIVVPRAGGTTPLPAHAARVLGRELRVALAQAVDPVARPRRWRFVTALPQDALGKCTHAACLELLERVPGAPRVLAEQGGAERRLLRLRVDPALPWFDGHFPGFPVLAGVVQVHWAIALGRERFALGARFAALEQLKFQRMIRPPAELELELRHDAARGRLEFAYRSADGAHSSGRVVFGD